MRWFRFAVSDFWSVTGVTMIAGGVSLYVAAVSTWGAWS